jgi:hypothetical protein
LSNNARFTGKLGCFLAAMMVVLSGRAAALEVQTGLVVIDDPDTTIEGLYRLHVGYWCII